MKKTAIAITLVVLIGSSVSAQLEGDTVLSIPGIEMETSIDKGEAYIGDLVTYEVKIIYDSTYELIPPPLGANLGAFDVKDYNPDIESRLDDGRIQSVTTGR